MAPRLPPPPDNNDLGPAVLAVNWVFASISIIVVATRFYVRRNIVQTFRIDDYLIYITLAFGLTLSSLVSVSIHFGLGKHVPVILAEGPEGPTNLMLAIKYVLISEIFVIMTPGIGRISYAFLLLDIIPPVTWRKRFLWSIITLQFIIDVTAVVVSLAQCSPMSAFWEGDHSKCWDPSVQADVGFFQGSFCSVVDLVMALFPASIFWNLQMKLSTKISLSILMGLGVFAMICSIVKTIQLKNIENTEDPTYAMAVLAIWFTLEAYMVLIAASLPTLRPLMRSVNVSLSKQNSSYPSYGTSHPGSDGFHSLVSTGVNSDRKGMHADSYHHLKGSSDGASNHSDPMATESEIPMNAIMRSTRTTVAAQSIPDTPMSPPEAYMRHLR